MMMSKFTEEKLELAFIELLEEQGINYQYGKEIARDESEILLKNDQLQSDVILAKSKTIESS